SITVGVIAALIVVLAIVFWPRDRIGPFKAEMNDYLTSPVPQRVQPGIGKLSGPAVVVSNDAKGLDDVHFKLPGRLKAEAPEQVKAVVRIQWGKTQVGRYTNGVPGYRHTCTVEVIDWSKKATVTVGQFE